MGRARRNAEATAHAAALPGYQAIDREVRDARRTARGARRANRTAYNALDRSLSQIGADQAGAYRALGADYAAGMQGVGSMFNVAGGGLEGVTGAGAFGSIGASGLRGLAQQKARGIDYTASTRRQGAIEKKTNALNILSDLRETIREAAERRHDLAAQEGANIMALIPEYKQQFFENRMDKRRLELEEAAAQREDELAKWYRNWLQGKYGKKKEEDEQTQLLRSIIDLQSPTYLSGDTDMYGNPMDERRLRNPYYDDGWTASGTTSGP